MNRREFLKAATSAGCLASFSSITSLAHAAKAPDKPILVTVFLRGGADGLHLVAPTADADYVAARPPELRVADSGDRAGILLDRSLDPAAGFRLHAEAAPLAGLYQSGRLAIVHAVGITDGTRSHFVAQDMIERGIGDEKRIPTVGTGWLARAIPGARGLVPAFSATPAPAFALHGSPSVLSAPDLSGGLGLPWGAPTSNLLRAFAMADYSPAHRATLATLDVLDAIDHNIPRDSAGKIAPYKPDGKANYDGSGDLTRTLASVARLAKMDVGLTAVCIDHGGWDTHEGQAGRFANQVKQLSLGLAAFQEDMAASGHKVVTVVMTEFGRRLRANKSNGTDHGHGACWFVLGDGVLGGRMYGKWPGLATPKLDQGVDLAVTTDYRAVLSEALDTCALARRECFPEFKPTSPLGLFG